MSILREKLFELLTWVIMSICAILFYFVATDFFIFPSKYKIPFLLLIILLICICGIFSIVSRYGFARFCGIMNIIWTVLILVLVILLPNFEKRIKNIFNNIQVDTAVVNVYVLRRNYKEDFNEYRNSIFITQGGVDQDNQRYALEELKRVLDKDNLHTTRQNDIISAAEALYNGEGELLIINEAYIANLEEIEDFVNFEQDTRLVYSINREIEVIQEEEPDDADKEITEKTFTVYVAGCDTRSGRLGIYGRTDVNILVTVNPLSKQILITGIPRDSYIPNPALNYGLDKLTHLGNNSIYNTMEGVSDYFDIDIDYYGEVIFDTFKNIIDALGGIDVDNPYYFTTLGGNGNYQTTTTYDFPQGGVHLDGTSALAYCRERYNLPNGDYGRNEHQTIVLKALIQKLLSPAIIENYDAVLRAMNGQFLTNMEVDDIYKLIGMQLNDNVSWDIISYHLGGEGDMCGTASMGWNRMLYVVHPFATQVNFIHGEIAKMENNELISQGKLPNEEDTTYIPN